MPLIPVIPSLAPVATACDAPALLPPANGSVAPPCPVISRSNELTLRIHSASIAAQRKVYDAITALQTQTPLIGNYIDFVLAYLEGFSIRIFTAEDLPAMLVPPRKGVTITGGYEGGTRALIFSEQAIGAIDFADTLRHEFRHAYWHAMQIYSFGNVAATRPNCIFPDTPHEKAKVTGFIDEGDAAVEELAHKLFKEGQGQLSQQEVKELNNLRLKCKKHDHLYEFPAEAKVSMEEFTAFQKGETHRLESPTRLYGNIKIIDKKLTSIPTITMHILDPLKRFVYIVRYDQKITRLYPQAEYVYEREARLYGSSPLPLVKKFYPKLFKYGADLARSTMVAPHPSAVGRAPTTTSVNFDYLQRVAELSNHDTLEQLRNIMGEARLINRLQTIVDGRAGAGAGALDIVNRMNYAVTYLVQNGLPIGRANILMARYANEQNDGLNACRYYHRAFKHASDFSFDDYLDCIDTLIENNHWGDAKTFCQRLRSSYLERNGYVPFEIETRWQRIKTLRRGHPYNPRE